MTEKNTTVATVGEPAQFPLSAASELGGSVIAAFLAIVGAVMYYKRKASRDGVEIVKDRVDADLTKNLMKIADEARAGEKEAWSKYNSLNAEVGELRATNEYQRKEIDRLTAEIATVQDKLDKVRDDLWKMRKTGRGPTDSGHTPLN